MKQQVIIDLAKHYEALAKEIEHYAGLGDKSNSTYDFARARTYVRVANDLMGMVEMEKAFRKARKDKAK